MQIDQLTLPGLTAAAPSFDGKTFDQAQDGKRMLSQLEAVRELLLSGGWWTVAQLTDAIWKMGIAATTQGVSARIRDLRKSKFGNYNVIGTRAAHGRGEWQFKIPQQ